MIKKNIKFYLTRDSVCAGDDIDPPHNKTFSFNRNKEISGILREIKEKYLPKIQGGKATWIAKHKGKAIAVLAQEWEELKFIDRETANEIFIESNKEIEIYIEYLAQYNPKKILKKCIKDNFFSISDLKGEI